jgi:hypothetical protein
MFLREVTIQSLLTELEGKQLQWFRHVKRMDRTRMRRVSEFKYKGKRHA